MAFAPRPLAFLDLETTGLGPGSHRITEVGVVTLQDGRAEEWDSLVNPGHLGNGHRAMEGVTEEALAAAPTFAAIAPDLARRLEGKLLVAHNARFDYAFLKAEFDRVGIAFQMPALCTVMLSRKLYPEGTGHSLDALMARHGLTATVRHRALPDAQLLHKFWQVVTSDFSARRLWTTIGKLLSDPLLPPHLNLALIEALPEKPGVYVLRDEDRRALRVVRARNLRREVRNYFRLDRISTKGAKLSYRVHTIDWHVTEGELSARLQELVLAKSEIRRAGKHLATPCTLRIDPAASHTVAAVVPAAHMVAERQALYGLFSSDRRARNALAKLAEEQRLCHQLLGLEHESCRTCDAAPETCQRNRPRHLLRVVTALAPLRMPHWPYAGAVGLREGRTVHVLDQWQVLGSARTAPEIAELADLRPTAFEPATYSFLLKALPKVPARRLKTLRRASRQRDDDAAA